MLREINTLLNLETIETENFKFLVVYLLVRKIVFIRTFYAFSKQDHLYFNLEPNIGRISKNMELFITLL